MAAAVLATLATTFLVGTATGGAHAQSAEGTIPIGAASASAQLYQVNPKTASLSLGIRFGVSLANYQNRAAIAESRGIDLGIIGTLLAAESCSGGEPTLPAEDQPQPTHVEARGEGESGGERGTDPNGSGVFEKFAEAQGQPRSLARTTATPIGIPGLVEITGGRSETRTEYLADGVREALAVADIGTLELAGGVVKLGGMHWEAIHRSGADEQSQGTFTIGSASIAGTPIPTNDPTAVIEQVNAAINPLGLQLTPPTAREGAGRQFVDPISVGFIPSELRDETIGQLVGQLQPVREEITNALLEASCSFGTLITVADVLAGSISGAGSLTLDLGGVEATTREIQGSSFLQPLPKLPPPDLVTPAAPAPAAPSGPSARSLSPAPTVAAPAAPPTTKPQPASQVAPTPLQPAGAGGNGRDALALVGLIGLGLLTAVAGGDIVKMRRAQRAIPVEA